jgi:hypothetical protein
MTYYLVQPNKDSESKQTVFSKVNNFGRKHRKAQFICKDWNLEISELWQYEVVEQNPKLFEPPGLVHVGQDRDGNCYKYHLRMNETPCTPRKTCQLRDEFRDAQDAEARKIIRLEKKNKSKSPLEEELQQQRKFERRRRQDDNWNPLEDYGE